MNTDAAGRQPGEDTAVDVAIGVQIHALGAASAERALKAGGRGRFSPAAADELRARMDSHAADVVSEAVRIAGRHQADVVSPAYVQQASEYLVARRRDRKFTLLGSLGAIVLGAAVPTLLEVLWTTAPSQFQVATSTIFGAIGAGMMALQFIKE